MPTLSFSEFSAAELLLLRQGMQLLQQCEEIAAIGGKISQNKQLASDSEREASLETTKAQNDAGIAKERTGMQAQCTDKMAKCVSDLGKAAAAWEAAKEKVARASGKLADPAQKDRASLVTASVNAQKDAADAKNEHDALRAECKATSSECDQVAETDKMATMAAKEAETSALGKAKAAASAEQAEKQESSVLAKLQKALLKAEKDILSFTEAKGPARSSLDKKIGALKRDNFMADQVLPTTPVVAPSIVQAHAFLKMIEARADVVRKQVDTQRLVAPPAGTAPFFRLQAAEAELAKFDKLSLSVKAIVTGAEATQELVIEAKRELEPRQKSMEETKKVLDDLVKRGEQRSGAKFVADAKVAYGKTLADYREYRTRYDEARARLTVKTSSAAAQLDVDRAEQVSAAAVAALETAKMDPAKAEDSATMWTLKDAVIVAGMAAKKMTQRAEGLKNVASMRAHQAIETAKMAVVAGTKGAAEQLAAARERAERLERATAVQASNDANTKLAQATLNLASAKLSKDNKKIGEAKGKEWDAKMQADEAYQLTIKEGRAAADRARIARDSARDALRSVRTQLNDHARAEQTSGAESTHIKLKSDLKVAQVALAAAECAYKKAQQTSGLTERAAAMGGLEAARMVMNTAVQMNGAASAQAEATGAIVDRYAARLAALEKTLAITREVISTKCRADIAGVRTCPDVSAALGGAGVVPKAGELTLMRAQCHFARGCRFIERLEEKTNKKTGKKEEGARKVYICLPVALARAGTVGSRMSDAMANLAAKFASMASNGELSGVKHHIITNLKNWEVAFLQEAPVAALSPVTGLPEGGFEKDGSWSEKTSFVCEKDADCNGGRGGCYKNKCFCNQG